MKMKKIVLLFSLIAVLFSVTGCSDGQPELDFEYSSVDIISDALYQSYLFQNASDEYKAYLADSEEEMAAVLLQGVNNFETVTEECGPFVGYRLKDGGSKFLDYYMLQQIQDEEQALIAQQELNALIIDSKTTVEENADTVVVTVTAEHEKRDCVYTFVYEKNPQYDYANLVYQQQVASFQIREVTAAPNYTFGEKMAKAGSNTLMGMGTVFAVLIFISFIIAQFGKINKLSEMFANRKKSKKEVQKDVSTTTSVETSAPAVSTNVVDDSQLVAVITAAVVAANTANGGTDKLIVRSIKKARR